MLRFGAAALALSPSTEQSADARLFDERFRPILVQYCVACHGPDKPRGKLRLDRLTTYFADVATRAGWTRVIDRLEAGELLQRMGIGVDTFGSGSATLTGLEMRG
jgi:hypothetical protein